MFYNELSMGYHPTKCVFGGMKGGVDKLAGWKVEKVRRLKGRERGAFFVSQSAFN